MNIDILNAYCGLGHSRGHACLRVGLKYLSRVVCCSRDGTSRNERSDYSPSSTCRSSYTVVRSGCCCRSRADPRRPKSRRFAHITRNRTSRVRRFGGTVARIVRTTPSSSVSLGPAGVAARTNQTERCVVVVVVVFAAAAAAAYLSRIRPEIRRDYPLNLSILISGGKETNQDSLSNGE